MGANGSPNCVTSHKAGNAFYVTPVHSYPLVVLLPFEIADYSKFLKRPIRLLSRVQTRWKSTFQGWLFGRDARVGGRSMSTRTNIHTSRTWNSTGRSAGSGDRNSASNSERRSRIRRDVEPSYLLGGLSFDDLPSGRSSPPLNPSVRSERRT